MMMKNGHVVEVIDDDERPLLVHNMCLVRPALLIIIMMITAFV